METNQPEVKPKASLLKLFLGVIFFPFALSYLILKQKQLPLIGRIAGVAFLWVVFIAIGSSSSKNSTRIEQVTSPTPTVLAISLEQKQKDFKDVYEKYYTRAQAMIVFQKEIQEAASSGMSREDLYMGLDRMEKAQSGIAWSNLDIKVPDSLKEYKKISDALFSFQLAGNNFTSAISRMKEYVNKNDLDKLSQAKEQLDRGVVNLSQSKDNMDAVAKELNVDISQAKSTK